MTHSLCRCWLLPGRNFSLKPLVRASSASKLVLSPPNLCFAQRLALAAPAARAPPLVLSHARLGSAGGAGTNALPSGHRSLTPQSTARSPSHLRRSQLFTSGEHAQFVKELLKHVDKEQVPLWIGGESTEPWPYGKSLDPLLPPWPHNPLDTLAEKTTLGSFARRVSESSYRGMHGAVDTLKHAAALPVEGMKHVHIPHPHVHVHISGGHATHSRDTRDKSK
eukprot:6198084-Pleurochrysis_carterae.AAC.6